MMRVNSRIEKWAANRSSYQLWAAIGPGPLFGLLS